MDWDAGCRSVNINKLLSLHCLVNCKMQIYFLFYPLSISCKLY
uniref:Uncharacterized protein n=1 Tax=Arundo donax TaxID=35708 RepID=A0A0A8YLC5_ARUDO